MKFNSDLKKGQNVMHFYADKELNQIRTVCFIHLSFVHNYLNKMNYLELSYLKKNNTVVFLITMAELLSLELFSSVKS